MENICSDQKKGHRPKVLFLWPGWHQVTQHHESTTINSNKAVQTWKKHFPPGWDTGDSLDFSSRGEGRANCPPRLSLPAQSPAHADVQLTPKPLHAQQGPGGLQREVKWHYSTEIPKLQPLISSTDHPRFLFPTHPKVSAFPLTSLFKEEETKMKSLFRITYKNENKMCLNLAFISLNQC